MNYFNKKMWFEENLKEKFPNSGTVKEPIQAQEKALCIHEFGFNSPCRYNNEVPSPPCGMDRNDYDKVQVLAVFLLIPPPLLPSSLPDVISPVL